MANQQGQQAEAEIRQGLRALIELGIRPTLSDRLLFDDSPSALFVLASAGDATDSQRLALAKYFREECERDVARLS